MDDSQTTIGGAETAPTMILYSKPQYEGDSCRVPALVCSIPPEVLHKILEMGKSLCEDELEDDEAEVDQSGMPFEIMISHVNSHFRKVALNTHSLWSTIRIAPEGSVNEVVAYIERSGSNKLEVQLTLSYAELQEKTQQMIKLILPHSPRWRAFYYRSVGHVQDITVLACLVNIAAPMLEELSLSIDRISNTTVGNPSQLSIFRKGAPMLCFVRLRGFAIYSLLPPLATVRILHLDQTKSIALGNSMFRQIVSAPQSLEHLSIYGDMVADLAWPSIHFPKLISLRIYDVGGRAYAGLLQGFNTPVLNALSLKGVQFHDLDRLWSIADPSRFSNLQCLTFWDFGLLAADWRHVFVLFSSVTNFSSYSSKDKSILLQLLADSGTKPIPWLHLKSLSFIFDAEDENEEALIKSVITIRRIRGHPLDVVRLGTNEDDAAFQGRYEGSTRIEYFRDLDKWPLERDFRDWDDNLFL